MATRRRSPSPPADEPRFDPAVSALLQERGHPLHEDIEVVRRIVLGADPAIEEAVKWNAPSYRTADFFATVHLRAQDTVQVVFHTGARKKPAAGGALQIEDPSGLLRWLAADRAIATLGRGADLAARTSALEDLVRAWLRAL
jgi:hypothetical protein